MYTHNSVFSLFFFSTRGHCKPCLVSRSFWILGSFTWYYNRLYSTIVFRAENCNSLVTSTGVHRAGKIHLSAQKDKIFPALVLVIGTQICKNITSTVPRNFFLYVSANSPFLLNFSTVKILSRVFFTILDHLHHEPLTRKHLVYDAVHTQASFNFTLTPPL